MPRVRRYEDNAVALPQATGARFAAADNDGGIGGALGAGLQQLGGALSRHADALAIREEHRARELEVASARELQDLQDSVRQTRGFAAEQAFATAQARVDAMRSEVLTGAERGPMRQMLADVFNQRADVARHEMEAHVEREIFASRVDLSMQRQALAQNDAIRAITPLGLQRNIQTALDGIEARGLLTRSDAASIAAEKARLIRAVENGRLERRPPLDSDTTGPALPLFGQAGQTPPEPGAQRLDAVYTRWTDGGPTEAIEGAMPAEGEAARPETPRLQPIGDQRPQDSPGRKWKRLPNSKARLQDSQLEGAELARRTLEAQLNAHDKRLMSLLGRLAPTRDGDFVRRQILDALDQIEIPRQLDHDGPFKVFAPEELAPGGKRERYYWGLVRNAAARALNERQRIALEFFTSPRGGGWSREQAAGIVANLTAESSLNPEKYQEPSRKGYGIAQWERGKERDQSFALFAGRPLVGASLEQQLAFVTWELTKGHKMFTDAGSKLRQATTAEDAARVFALDYERMRDKLQEPVRRARAATDIYREFYGQ